MDHGLIPFPSRIRVTLPPACTLLLTILVACSADRSNPESPSSRSHTVTDPTLPANFSVSSAYVFIPTWEGAEGFSAGGKYVIQGGLFGTDRSKLSGGDPFFGLPEDGGPRIAFEIIGSSLEGEHIEVHTAGSKGQQYSGDGTNIWVVYDDTQSGWHDLKQSRLLQTLDGGHRPHGEGEHALRVAIDLNGDGKPDYAEFSHYCKAEQAPYPLDANGQTAWSDEHGEVDWDTTCSNTFTIRAGVWEKGARKTPR